jgi:hypothetical protein
LLIKSIGVVILPKHWTLQYIFDKSRYVAFRWTHPHTPWFTPDAIDFLENHLKPTHEGFEWGSGWSTLWLAKRLARLVSVEHDPKWSAQVSRQLLRNSQHTAKVLLEQVENSYIHAIERMSKRTLDLIIVDGLDSLRDRCALLALEYVKPGGLLLVDDIHRYLPSNSRSPKSIPPNSQPRTPLWQEFANKTKDWEAIWTSSGVTDTAIWRSPKTH